MAESMSDEELMAALSSPVASMSDEDLLAALDVPRGTSQESILPAPVAEGASAVNRGVVAIPDFLIDAANTAMQQIPSLAPVLEPILGGQAPQIPRVEDTIKGVVPEFGQENFMGPGVARDVVQAGGEFLPGVATVVGGTVPTAAKALQGLTDDAASAAARTAGQLRTGDKRAVGSTFDAAGEVVSDPAAKEAIRQGFEERVVSRIKAASESTKQSLRRMTAIAERGVNVDSARRPADEFGRVVSDQVKVIAKTNRAAGTRLNAVAKTLKGKTADISQARTQFLDDLSEIGVKVNDTKVDLTGSQIEDIPGAKESLELMLRRLGAVGDDAFKSHSLKRFIDTRVNFDKQGGTIADAVERTFKDLRHNIDQSLDAKFPAYKKVNDVFSETRGALDAFSGAAGKKLNVETSGAETQIGTLSRALTSNRQKRGEIEDALALIGDIAQKHGADASVDLRTLSRFADQLDNVLTPVAKTGFRNEIGKAAGDVITEGATRAAFNKITDSTVGKITGTVSEEQAIQALKDLLR